MSTTAGRRRQVRARRLATLALAVTTGLATALGGVLLTGSAASAATSQYGTLSAASGSLPAANQCGTYTYSYDIAPPPGDWALETTVIDPRGLAVSSFAVIGGYSPGGANASTSYTLCSNNTLPGTFTITGKLSTSDANSKVTNYEMTPATFTLTAAPVTGTTTKLGKNKSAKKKAELRKKKKRHQKKRHHRR
jgi:hypothetical protein